MSDLTPRQERFVAEYLVDLNATQAAIRAGYSARTANREGTRLLSHAVIQEMIQKAQADRQERTEVTQDRVVLELARMAFYDAGEIASHPLAGPQDIPRLPENVRRAIVGWSWDKAGNFVVRLSPKTPSLDLLARHLGMLKTVNQQLGADGKPIDAAPVYQVIIN